MRLSNTAAFLLLFVGSVSGQSKQTLRAKYGEPARETFLSEGLAISVQYDSHDEACELRIEPRLNLGVPGAAAMTDQQLDKVLNELIPGDRGGSYLSAITNAGVGFMGVGGSSQNYKNFSLSRSIISNNVPGGQFQFATVHLARSECGQIVRSGCYYAPEPQYTEAARKAHVKGAIAVQGTIGVDGCVRDGKITARMRDPKVIDEPLGYGLDEAAIDVLRFWRCQPQTTNGQATPTELRVWLSFDPQTPSTSAAPNMKVCTEAVGDSVRKSKP